MKFCELCGMPLEKKEDVGKEIEEGLVCIYCVNEDGSLKNCKEVFEGGVQFFMKAVPDVDEDLARRITLKNMLSQPYWQKCKDEECLKGDVASDEEFKHVLNMLHAQIEEDNSST